jgi:hypothetical protein
MNERIFELAKQADLIHWDTLPSGARTPDHESVVKAKRFAELLQQAIYDKVKEELIPDDVIAEENPQFQEYLKGCNGGTVDALCHIKNFGVDINE